jgi:hypothetical protein
MIAMTIFIAHLVARMRHYTNAGLGFALQRRTRRRPIQET